MKQKDLVQLVEEKFRIINKLSLKVTTTFNSDCILEFRQEVKKLRSLIRLLSYQQPLAAPVVLPKKLKTFYGYAGIIRNLQMQQEAIQTYCGKTGSKLPASYLHIIENETTFWKIEAANFMADARNFYEDEEKLVEMIPSTLKPLCIEAFINNKVQDICGQLSHLHDDEALHKIRKLLKDIVYNWRLLKDHAGALPAGLHTEEQILSFTVPLGKFRNICIALNHLKAAHVDRIRNEEERQLLQQVEYNWQLQKEPMKEEIIDMLMQVPLLSSRMSNACRRACIKESVY